MVGTNNIIKIEKSSPEEFVNIKKNIFQLTDQINDRIVPPKEFVKDSYSDRKKQLKTEECISDNYQFIGSYCQHCDFRPKERTPAVLEVHMRSHTGDKPFSCAICDFSSASKYYLETHMRKHTGERPFHCPTCQFSASRKQVLKIHLLTHTNEKPFVCTECNFKCARKKGLEQHWSFHCKFQHFRCSVCDYKCRKLKDLKIHVLTHPAVISCSSCDFMGRCKEDLEKHNISHTQRVPKIVPKKEKKIVPKSVPERKICSKCGKSYATRESLRKHISKNNCK